MNYFLNTNEFQPMGPFKNGDFQTIYAALLHRPGKWKPDKRVLLEVSPEALIACDWNLVDSPYCAILIHGLEASSQANYIVSTGRKLQKFGFDVCRVNLRNCGNTHHLSQTFYNAGLSADICHVINSCIQDGYKYIYVAGFSLGANIALKMAGEYGSDYPDALKGICAVSAPLDLSECSASLRLFRNKIYDRYYLNQMKSTYRRKHQQFPERFKSVLLKKLKRLYDVDNHVVAPAFQYRDAEDYYQQNSSLYFLESIRLPTLLVQSKDDPIIPFGSTKHALRLSNPHLHFLVTEGGGHVGFINGYQAAQSDIDQLWAENRVVAFGKKVMA